MVLKVPTKFHQNIIMSSYADLLQEASAAVLGTEFHLRFVTEDQMEKEKEKVEQEKKIKRDDSCFTFDTYIVGPSNKLAHAASMAVATNPANLYNPLFIHGNAAWAKPTCSMQSARKSPEITQT